MAINEAHCTKELINSFISKSIWAYKIPDSYDMVERPFDVVVNYKGQAVAIECKFYREFKAFGLSQIRDSQIRNLNSFTNSEGYAFIILFVRGNTAKEVEGRYNRMYLFEWESFRDRCSEASYKKKELLLLKNYTHGKKKLYDLSIFFNQFL